MYPYWISQIQGSPRTPKGTEIRCWHWNCKSQVPVLPGILLVLVVWKTRRRKRKRNLTIGKENAYTMKQESIRNSRQLLALNCSWEKSYNQLYQTSSIRENNTGQPVGAFIRIISEAYITFTVTIMPLSPASVSWAHHTSHSLGNCCSAAPQLKLGWLHEADFAFCPQNKSSQQTVSHTQPVFKQTDTSGKQGGRELLFHRAPLHQLQHFFPDRRVTPRTFAISLGILPEGRDLPGVECTPSFPQLWRGATILTAVPKIRK